MSRDFAWVRAHSAPQGEPNPNPAACIIVEEADPGLLEG